MGFINALELIIVASLFGYFFTKLAVWSVKKYLNKQLPDFNEEDIQKLDMTLGISTALPLLLFSFISAVLKPSAFGFLCVYLASILSCLIVIGFFKKHSVRTQLLGLTLLCFIGTFFLPCSVLVQGLVGLGVQFLITLFWMLFLYAFIQVDRVPFLSAWLSLGYMVFALLMFDSHAEGSISNFAVILLSFSLGIVFYLRTVIAPRLGVTASIFIGFLWGFFASYPMAIGHYATSLYAGGYLFLEVAYATLFTLILTKTIFPIQAPFLIERALLTEVKQDKALQFVMLMNIVLCWMGFFQIRSVASFSMRLGMLAFVLFFIAYKLLQWGKKRVRFRDLFSDVKQGMRELLQKEKQKAKEVSQKQDILSTKKEEVKKTAPVKAVEKRTSAVQKTSAGDTKKTVVKKTPVIEKKGIVKKQQKTKKQPTSLKKTPLKIKTKKTVRATRK